MEEFNELLSWAQNAGCSDVVGKMSAAASELKEQKFTKIAVTGMRNSGKTTLINEIVGSEIREPGNMEDDEPALRVCFEQVADEEGIECVMAANHEWHDLSALIYEFRQEDMISDGHLADKMYSIDMVCFLISATAPFNIDEVNYLKAMAPLHRQVIVTGIENVRENERQKVIDYIVKINDSLGLDPVIILDNAQDYGRIIRDAVPGYMELKENRISKVRNIYLQTVDRLKEAIEQKINDYEKKAREAAEKRFALSTEEKRIKADAYTIRMDIESYKRKSVERIGKDMYSQLDGIVSDAIRDIGRTDDVDKIQKNADQRYHNVAKLAMKKLNDAYMADLKKVDSAVKLVAIPGWSDEVVKDLKRYAPRHDVQDLYNNNFPPGCQDPILPNPVVRSVVVHSESTKILLGTGLAIGGFVLAPLPTAVSWAGGIAAAGIGGTSYVKKRQEENTSALAKGLKDALKKGMDNIDEVLHQSADMCYGKVAERIFSLEETLGADDLQDPTQGKGLEELKSMLEKVQSIQNRP